MMFRQLLTSILILISALFFPKNSAANTFALIVANANYQNFAPLRTPHFDADLVGNAFKQLGIKTLVLKDLNRLEFLKAIIKFDSAIKGSKRVVFYFAGHGVHINGESYLMPVDADFSMESWRENVVSLSLLAQAFSNETRQKIFVIDACRDNPAYLQANAAKKPIRKTVHAGTFQIFSAQPGAQAADGTNMHSPFAVSFSRALLNGNVEIEIVARKIRLDVIRATGGRQIPWSQSSLLRPVFLSRNSARTE